MKKHKNFSALSNREDCDEDDDEEKIILSLPPLY